MIQNINPKSNILNLRLPLNCVNDSPLLDFLISTDNISISNMGWMLEKIINCQKNEPSIWNISGLPCTTIEDHFSEKNMHSF